MMQVPRPVPLAPPAGITRQDHVAGRSAGSLAILGLLGLQDANEPCRHHTTRKGWFVHQQQDIERIAFGGSG
jgi:hypothetical protein